MDELPPSFLALSILPLHFSLLCSCMNGLQIICSYSSFTLLVTPLKDSLLPSWLSMSSVTFLTYISFITSSSSLLFLLFPSLYLIFLFNCFLSSFIFLLTCFFSLFRPFLVNQCFLTSIPLSHIVLLPTCLLPPEFFLPPSLSPPPSFEPHVSFPFPPALPLLVLYHSFLLTSSFPLQSSPPFKSPFPTLVPTSSFLTFLLPFHVLYLLFLLLYPSLSLSFCPYFTLFLISLLPTPSSIPPDIPPSSLLSSYTLLHLHSPLPSTLQPPPSFPASYFPLYRTSLLSSSVCPSALASSSRTLSHHTVTSSSSSSSLGPHSCQVAWCFWPKQPLGVTVQLCGGNCRRRRPVKTSSGEAQGGVRRC